MPLTEGLPKMLEEHDTEPRLPACVTQQFTSLLQSLHSYCLFEVALISGHRLNLKHFNLTFQMQNLLFVNVLLNSLECCFYFYSKLVMSGSHNVS